jgi:hypothetical protein
MDGTATDTYGFGETNMRIGLTNQSELDLIWQPRHSTPAIPGIVRPLFGIACRLCERHSESPHLRVRSHR